MNQNPKKHYFTKIYNGITNDLKISNRHSQTQFQECTKLYYSPTLTQNIGK